VKRVCRDCTKVSSGKGGRCEYCRSSNLSAYYSPKERRSATQTGSDWRSHLYVSGAEHQGTRSSSHLAHRPKNSAAPNAASKALKRTRRNPRSDRSTDKGANRIVEAISATPLAWLTIILMPSLVLAINLLPATALEEAIDKQARALFGILEDSQPLASIGSSETEASLGARSEALESLWDSRREANTVGYVETIGFEALTSVAISHPAVSDVVAYPNGERLDWGEASKNYTLAGLAEAITDAALNFTREGERIVFDNPFTDCQGWVVITDGLITAYETDCYLLSAGNPRYLRYGLTPAELELIEEARRLRDG
jgi:hypothetical protein